MGAGMDPLRLSIFLVLCAVNEASSAGLSASMRVASRAEIMATMTSESAAQVVWRLGRERKKPDVMSLIQTRYGSSIRDDEASMQTDMDEQQDDEAQQSETGLGAKLHRVMVKLHSLRGASNSTPATGYSSAVTAATGYAAVASATAMLNEMGEETRDNLEAEINKCDREDREMHQKMQIMREAVSTFNSRAAASRGKVVTAQGEISTLEINVQTTTEEFHQHKETCRQELATLNYQLSVVQADIAVMTKVLNMIDCSASTTATNLVQCDHCDGVFVQDDKVQAMLSSLKSDTAKHIVKSTLEESYDDSLNDQEPVALTQEAVQHMRNARGRRHEHMHAHQSGPDDNFTNESGLNITDVPEAPEPVDCQPTTRCTLGSNPNCQKLKDKFLVVQTGILDQRDEIEEEIGRKQTYCETQDESFKTAIDGMEVRLRQERSNLAFATDEQNQAEEGSHVNSQQHESTSSEYTRTMKTCCDNKNTMTSELCALDKIRGELNNVNGTTVFITDCEVSDWREEECTATCGGGTMKKTRSVIAHPVGGGMTCPPLEESVSCNLDPCPQDCVVQEWGGWSACSAECGGGVTQRARGVQVEPKFNGEPCGDTEEETSCHLGACNVDCQLSEWSSWGQCSKECGGGKKRRVKTIAVPARGTGKCAGPEDDERLDFKDCNRNSCEAMLRHTPRKVLQCSSYVDITILLDGSGSLGWYGWYKSKQVTSALISGLDDGSDKVRVQLQLFSGPSGLDNYYACTGDGDLTNMGTQCGISWISGYTNNFANLAWQTSRLDWPARSTLTSVALGEADQRLRYGRQNAQSVVIVITDGMPLSQHNTRKAAEKLQKDSKVLWIPIGNRAPLELIEELASKPESDHVIKVSSFYSLRWSNARNRLLNKIISTTCPHVS